MYSRWRRRFRSINASSRSPRSSRRPAALACVRDLLPMKASAASASTRARSRPARCSSRCAARRPTVTTTFNELPRSAPGPRSSRPAAVILLSIASRSTIPSTRSARLAHYHLARTRAARALPLIAIGGAVGKTTTKELTAAVARALFGATLSTPGNLNNLIGVPMTIFTLTGESSRGRPRMRHQHARRNSEARANRRARRRDGPQRRSRT